MKHQKNTVERANNLVEKFSEGRCSHEEALEVARWFKEPSFQPLLYGALSKLWYRNLETEDHFEKANNLHSTLDKIHHSINIFREHEFSRLHKRVRLSKILLRAAAVLLLPFLTLSILYVQERFEVFPKKVLYTEVSVANGSKLNTVLPDGTEVWLNSGSTLKYPQTFSRNSRKATLSGEAYFNVIADQSHPFVVSTEALDIKVTGTLFNVMAYPEDNFISATLEEGQITVEKQNTNGCKSQLIYLDPKERMVFRKDQGTFGKTIVATDQFTSWKDGMLIFRNNTLDYIIGRLERWYNTDIEISNGGTLPQTPFTMTIKDENIEQVLEYLSIASGIVYEVVPSRKQENGEISKRRYIIRNIE